MTIDTYFTQNSNVKKIILDCLDQANHKVLVAVAWFTETRLFEKLIELSKRGVIVELIITKHQFNQQSNNDYKLISENGFFAEIGSDEQLMHMKFCVIDNDIVISGSANWTKRAFKTNNEEVTIIQGNFQRASDFIAEFERLKELSGLYKKNEKGLDIAKAIKYFDVIKALINIGEDSKIPAYALELNNMDELKPIVHMLLEGNYSNAISEMEIFRKKNTQILDVTSLLREQLQSQIKLLAFQIETLEIEKIELESLVAQFNHKCILILNPLITKILALKKKIYEKLKKHGINDDYYDSLNREFNKKNQEYQNEKRTIIHDLNEQDSRDIKSMHREAVKLCHPDSTSCIFENKEEAARIFSELTSAFKRNDIQKVREILNHLKDENTGSIITENSEIEYLKLKLASLKFKYRELVNKINAIKSLDNYEIICRISDWDAYFEEQKELLEAQLNELNSKYVNHE